MPQIRYLSESAIVLAADPKDGTIVKRDLKKEGDFPLIVVNADEWGEKGFGEALRFARKNYPGRYLDAIKEELFANADGYKKPDINDRLVRVLISFLGQGFGNKDERVNKLFKDVSTEMAKFSDDREKLKTFCLTALPKMLKPVIDVVLTEKLDALETDFAKDPVKFLKTYGPSKGWFWSPDYTPEIKRREEAKTSIEGNPLLPKELVDVIRDIGCEVVVAADLSKVSPSSGGPNALGSSAHFMRRLYLASGRYNETISLEEMIHYTDDQHGFTKSSEWKEAVTDLTKNPSAIKLLNSAIAFRAGKNPSFNYGNHYNIEAAVKGLETGNLNSAVFPEILPDMAHVQNHLAEVAMLRKLMQLDQSQKNLLTRSAQIMLNGIEEELKLGSEESVKDAEIIRWMDGSKFVGKTDKYSLAKEARKELFSKALETFTHEDFESFHKEVTTRMEKDFGNVFIMYKNFMEQKVAPGVSVENIYIHPSAVRSQSLIDTEPAEALHALREAIGVPATPPVAKVKAK